MEVRYIAVNNNTKTWEEDEKVFETLEAANAYARMIWNHLTDREKAAREVFVVRVTEADIEEDFIDEDGTIEWVLPSSYDIAEGGFNSGEEAL